MRYYYYEHIAIVISKKDKKYTFIYVDKLLDKNIKVKKIGALKLRFIGLIARVKKYTLVNNEELL